MNKTKEDIIVKLREKLSDAKEREKQSGLEFEASFKRNGGWNRSVTTKSDNYLKDQGAVNAFADSLELAMGLEE